MTERRTDRRTDDGLRERMAVLETNVERLHDDLSEIKELLRTVRIEIDDLSSWKLKIFGAAGLLMFVWGIVGNKIFAVLK